MVMGIDDMALAAAAATAGATIFSMTAPYISRLASSIAAGVTPAVQATSAFIGDMLSGAGSRVPQVDPAFKGVDVERLKRTSFSNIPAGITLQGLIQQGAMIFGTVAFFQFIHEEAIQAVSMGIWQAVSNELYDEADKLIETAKDIINKLRFACVVGFPMNPFSSETFFTYADAAEKQIHAFEKIIEKKRKGGEVKQYTRVSGGIYDMR